MKNKKVLLFTFAFTFMVIIILACKTPVYKYAILNWNERDYYQVLRIYDSTKKQIDIDPEVKKQFEGKEYITNVGFIPIDISQDLDQMYGEDFKTFLKANMGDKTAPFHIIMNPRKNVIYNGDLKADDIPKLIMSPKRVELAQKLSIGKIMLILVESTDAEKNKKAIDEIKKGIKKSIDIELDIRSQGEDPTAPPIDKKTLKPIDMEFVTVNPSDANETWFYRQLIKVNPKLEASNEPMVFGIVGRGFVFDQCLVGEYLTEEQIVNMAIFLSGPCSCTVKAENGGVDILTSWDWDKTIKVKLEANEEDDSEKAVAKVPGFGGDEVDSNAVDTAKDKANKTQEKPGDQKEKAEVKESTASKESVKEEPKLLKNEKDSKKELTKLDSEQPVNESDFLKIILFAIAGAVVLLVVITKVMKVNKE